MEETKKIIDAQENIWVEEKIR